MTFKKHFVKNDYNPREIDINTFRSTSNIKIFISALLVMLKNCSCPKFGD